jgi:uncharacterized protein YjdB
MLCLGLVCINSNVKAYEYDYSAYEILNTDNINITLGNKIQLDMYSDDYYYWDTESEGVLSYKVSNDNVSISKGDGSYYNLTGKKAGKSVLKVYKDNEYYKDISIYVVNPKLVKTSYTVYSTSDDDWDGYKAEIKINGINEYSQFLCEYDYGDYWFDSSNLITKGYISVYLYDEGKTTIKFNIDGKDLTATINAVKVNFKLSGTINTQLGSIVSYAGKTDTIKVSGASIKKWKSTNTKIATISKSAKKSVTVKAKSIGRCYIRGYINNNDYIECLVEVTYKGAYQAVSNGFKDYLKGDYNKTSKPIKYSQSKRMSKGYRDCSSFVSRCYYDTTLNRKIYKIGSIKGNYASTAADQAKWLNANGKKVADKYVDSSKLLPGDTIYRGGSDKKRWRGIYHAILYVGNGYVLTTGSSTDTDDATLQLKYYSYCSSNVAFIGRPLKTKKTVSTTSISLNKTKITIKKNKKYTLKATVKPKNSTQKVTWSSSNKKIATVSSKGVVTAKKKGTVYITAKSGSKTKKCKVTVK